jgi:hypothetical protein
MIFLYSQNSSLYIAASPGNFKAGFQASGFHHFNRDTFKEKEYKLLLAYVTDKSAPPVAAPASTRDSEPPDMSVNFPEPLLST